MKPLAIAGIAAVAGSIALAVLFPRFDPSAKVPLRLDRKLAVERARELLGVAGIKRLLLSSGGHVLVDVGSPNAIAALSRDVIGSSGRRIGRLQVSVITAPAFASLVPSTCTVMPRSWACAQIAAISEVEHDHAGARDDAPQWRGQDHRHSDHVAAALGHAL